MEREELRFWLSLTAGVASGTAESNTSGGAQPSAASEDEEGGMAPSLVQELVMQYEARERMAQGNAHGAQQARSSCSVGIEPISEQCVSQHARNPLCGDEGTGCAESSVSDGAQQECASTGSEARWERSSNEEASCAWEHPQVGEVMEFHTPWGLVTVVPGVDEVCVYSHVSACESSSVREEGDPG
ncbi:hypothetical protein HXX76_006159 [Chlamydomonas incerta]|uniref:Uncharacterized protein n=1 Tax=Chlamydomonas incerta TaxID=51695 RepID=A0A835TFV6_CHLIN|nr:hypothetical protein HXX76_006159 [Chlamydomonas incerta]|eukprot:KAG2437511.1 hypothetical protein HXX76_006159 [Chlamydomonas incerta]